VPASGYAARLTHNPLRDDCGVPSNELVGRHMVLGVLPHRAQERR